ncbi:MAG: energy-coupled thiamine transporter ThiT [Candidatus Bathyarchaeales archaeon]
MSKKQFETKVLAEIIVVVALSGVLYSLRPFSMPFGGSVTLGSMVPVMWLALRRGAKIGVFAGAVFGLLALPIDVLMLPYSPVANPAQVFLDYPLAFAALGLAGFFKGKKEPPKDLAEVGVYALLFSLTFVGVIVHNFVWLVPALVFFGLSVWGVIEKKAWQSPIVGVVVAGVGKFLAHFVSGVVFWSAYAPPELGPYLYSAVYNGSFLIPEFIVSAFLIYLLVQRGTVEIKE